MIKDRQMSQLLTLMRYQITSLSVPYEFTDDDLNICISQLKTFLDMYQDIPYKVGEWKLLSAFDYLLVSIVTTDHSSISVSPPYLHYTLLL